MSTIVQRSRGAALAGLTLLGLVAAPPPWRGVRNVNPGMMSTRSPMTMHQPMTMRLPITQSAMTVHQPIIHQPIIHQPILQQPILHQPVMRQPIMQQPRIVPQVTPNSASFLTRPVFPLRSVNATFAARNSNPYAGSIGGGSGTGPYATGSGTSTPNAYGSGGTNPYGTPPGGYNAANPYAILGVSSYNPPSDTIGQGEPARQGEREAKKNLGSEK